MKIYIDYSLPTPASCIPQRVCIEPAKPSGWVVVGHWKDLGSDNIKLCAGEIGADLTQKAWSGQPVDPKALPMAVTVEEISRVSSDGELEEMCQRAAHSVGLHLNLEYTCLALAQEADALHPALAALLREAQRVFHGL